MKSNVLNLINYFIWGISFLIATLIAILKESIAFACLSIALAIIWRRYD